MAPTVTQLALPPLRSDPAQAAADLDTFGVARVADALNPGEVATLRARLERQAAAEDSRRWVVPTYFCRPWMRPQENYTLSTDPAVIATASPELLGLLGLRVWRTLGGVQGPWGPGTPGVQGFRADGIVSRYVPRIAEMGGTS